MGKKELDIQGSDKQHPDSYDNGEFLRTHYADDPPFYSVEASEEVLFIVRNGCKKPPIRRLS